MPERTADARWDGSLEEGVETKATVHIEEAGEGFAISRIDLDTRARVPVASNEELQQAAAAAKEGCPVSKALAGVDSIELQATLVE